MREQEKDCTSELRGQEGIGSQLRGGRRRQQEGAMG